MTLLDTRWPALLAGLPGSLDLKQTARECGAFVRPRKVRSPEDLLRLGLVYGLGKLSLRGTALWAACTGVADLTDEALLERLCKAARWFERIVQARLAERLPRPSAGWRGDRLRRIDATTLSQPGSAGTDGRLHVADDLETAMMTTISLTDQHGAESLDRVPVGPGDVVIGDRGYARAADLERLRHTGADVIVRLGWRSLRLQTAAGKPLDLLAALRAVPAEGAVAQDVVVVDPRCRKRRIPRRLILKRKMPEAAERARAQLRKQRSRKGGQLDPRSLEAAALMIVLTSLPADRVSAEAVLSRTGCAGKSSCCSSG